MKTVEIYTDGACSKNPGRGGYGAILIYNGREKELSGYQETTTNNEMELMAAVEALEALKEPCIVNLYTDSAYIFNAFTKDWVKKWQQNGFINSKKQPVENQQLFIRLIELSGIHQINWIKVKGHSGQEYNERCDKLAKKEITLNKTKE